MDACSDFRTPIGESTEWVAAYVAGSLSNCSENEQALVRATRLLLRCQRMNGGWGYGHLSPPDADSTAAALLFLARRPEVPAQSIERAVSFLVDHVDPRDGGIRTYRRTWGLRVLMRAWQTSFDGWQSSHVCVAAVAARALDSTRQSPADTTRAVSEYLRIRQKADGLWRGYWWDDPLYATAGALRFLRRNGAMPELRFDAASAIRARQHTDGSWSTPDGQRDSPFATALAVDSLCALGLTTSVAVQRAADWLVEAQRDDGSWTSVPIMRIPHPCEMEPDQVADWRIDQLGTGVLIRDQHRRFTTATVTRSLTCVANDRMSDKSTAGGARAAAHGVFPRRPLTAACGR